jgi:hypothetical protein
MLNVVMLNVVWPEAMARLVAQYTNDPKFKGLNPASDTKSFYYKSFY